MKNERNMWRSAVLPIIALVALVQIPLTQLRFATTIDDCLTFPDVLPVLDIKDDTSGDSDKEGVHEQPMSFSPQSPADGRFMNHPIYYRSPVDLQSFHSTSHCVGDNFDERVSWKFKTCQFENLCFDMISHEFVIFASPEQLQLKRVLSNRNLTFFSASSSMLNNSVSIGGLNPKWARDIDKMKWFPTVMDVKSILKPNSEGNGGVYILPNNVFMLPFHSMAGMNVGHLIWDDWLPLYTIMETFDYLDREPLFIRYILKDSQWGSCDYHKNVEKCARMMSKFLPLLGVGNTDDNNKLYTINDFNFSLDDTDIQGQSAKSRYICAQNGLAGLGMLTDHGSKLHGWGPKDYQSSHNINRGASLYRFRNYMMNNIGVSTAPLRNIIKKSKFKIVFSMRSSSTGNRQLSFDDRAALLKRSELKEKYDIEIVMVELAKMSMREQVELISTTSILITVCGGGSVTASFLPKGSSLFIFFNEEEGDGDTPARLDWDMFNHISYIRTHWLPRPKKTIKMKGSSTGPQEVDHEAFVKLVDHELDIISHL